MKLDDYVLQRARQLWPDQDMLNVSLIETGGGEASDVFIYDVGGRRIVLKKSKIEDRWKNLRREFDILQQLERTGLAQTPYFFDEENQILAYEFVVGKSLDNESAKAHIAEVAKIARRIHSLRQEDLGSGVRFANYGELFDFPLEIERYVRTRLAEVRGLMKDLEFWILSETIDRGIERLHAAKSLFADKSASFCHKDFKPWNLVLQPSGTIMPIDWNFFDLCDPAFDLSLFARSSDLGDTERQKLFQNYDSEDKTLVQRAGVYMDFCRMPCILWHIDKLKNPIYTLTEDRACRYRKYAGRYLRELVDEGNADTGLVDLIS